MRLTLSGFVAGCVFITGCQQTKMSSEPVKPAAQAAPAQSSPPPAGYRTPPPSGPGYQPGPVTQGPPPGGPGPMPALPPPTNGDPNYYPPPQQPGPVVNYPPPQTNPPNSNYPNQPNQPNDPRPIQPTSPPPVVTSPPPNEPYNPPSDPQPQQPGPTTQPTTVYTPPPTYNPGENPNLQQPPVVPSTVVQPPPVVVAPPNQPPTTTVTPPPPPPQEDCRTQACQPLPIPPVPPDYVPPPANPGPQQPPVAKQPDLPVPPIPPDYIPPQQKPGTSQQPPPRTTFPPIGEGGTPQPERPAEDQGPKQCPVRPIDHALDATKLDVIFVVDASASLRGGINKGTGGELGQLARDVVFYADKLDPAIDLNIGMILGHGPASTRYHGQLFRADSNDPAVIKMSDLKKNCRGSSEELKRCAQNKIGKLLERKILGMPIDTSDAQGEALNLSLYNSIMNPRNKAAIVNEGLFRPDAKLQVIMISDEQDVCYDYASGNYKPVQVPHKDAKGKITGYGPDIYETRFFETVCKTATVDRKPLTPLAVANALLSLKTDKNQIMVNPVIYTSDNGLRNADGTSLQPEDENEMGHFYIEVAQEFGSDIVDLAQVTRTEQGGVSFANQLATLGKITDAKMRYSNDIPCNIPGLHMNSVNATSVTAYIMPKGATHPEDRIALFTGACAPNSNCTNADGNVKTSIVPNGRGGYTLHFILEESKINELLSKNKITDAEVRILFNTSTNARPATWDVAPGTPRLQQQRQAPVNNGYDSSSAYF